MRKKTLVILLSTLCLLVITCLCLFTGCEEGNNAYQKDKDTQESIMNRAQAAVPAYQINNFLEREAINKWAERIDTPNKLWYVYIMGENGNFIGYYVSSTMPLSYMIAITSPYQIQYGNVSNKTDSTVVMPAPGIDGVYAEGSDPSLYYFFDAETGAMITTNMKLTYLDMPLDIVVPKLNIKVTP